MEVEGRRHVHRYCRTSTRSSIRVSPSRTCSDRRCRSASFDYSGWRVVRSTAVDGSWNTLTCVGSDPLEQIKREKEGTLSDYDWHSVRRQPKWDRSAFSKRWGDRDRFHGSIVMADSTWTWRSVECREGFAGSITSQKHHIL